MSPMSTAEARALVASGLAELDAAGTGEAASAALVKWSELRVRQEADGTQVFTMPYPQYPPWLGEVWSAITALGFLEPCAYRSWLDARGDGPLDADAIAGMDRDDLHMTLVYFSRGERFCDGWKAGLIADGSLRAALARLLALTDGRADPA